MFEWRTKAAPNSRTSHWLPPCTAVRKYCYTDTPTVVLWCGLCINRLFFYFCFHIAIYLVYILIICSAIVSLLIIILHWQYTCNPKDSISLQYATNQLNYTSFVLGWAWVSPIRGHQCGSCHDVYMYTCNSYNTPTSAMAECIYSCHNNGKGVITVVLQSTAETLHPQWHNTEIVA